MGIRVKVEGFGNVLAYGRRRSPTDLARIHPAQGFRLADAHFVRRLDRWNDIARRRLPRASSRHPRNRTVSIYTRKALAPPLREFGLRGAGQIHPSLSAFRSTRHAGWRRAARLVKMRLEFSSNFEALYAKSRITVFIIFPYSLCKLHILTRQIHHFYQIIVILFF